MNDALQLADPTAGMASLKFGSLANAGTRFLVIRRDNIGDLVCTTPLIRLLRGRFPKAHIAALVNGYNKGVLAGNGDLDAVYDYSKAKHVRGERGLLSLYLERIQLIRRLRGERFDFVILASSAYQRSAVRLARFVGARHVVGYLPASGSPRIIDCPVYPNAGEVVHEVEAVCRLLTPFGIQERAPAAKVYPDESTVSRMREALGLDRGNDAVGIHISARTAEGRWPAERFRSLIEWLATSGERRILLFWSPGDAANSRHPGDDANASRILAACTGLPVQGCPTARIEDLVAGLSLCRTVVCCDGGAMHLAAALGKTVIALFGNDPARWHPWQTDYVVLRAPSGRASDISIEEVTASFSRLYRQAAA